MSQTNQFESFYGISLESAKKGQKLRVAYRINCQHNRSEEDQIRLIADVLDNFAYPEVMRRIKNRNIILGVQTTLCSHGNVPRFQS